MHVNKKLHAQSVQSIFVGYNESTSAYLISLFKNSTIKKICCIRFIDTLKNKPYKIESSSLMSEEVEMLWSEFIQSDSPERGQ